MQKSSRLRYIGVLRWLLASPSFPENGDKTRLAEVLNSVERNLLVVFAIALLDVFFIYTNKALNALVSFSALFLLALVVMCFHTCRFFQ